MQQQLIDNPSQCELEWEGMPEFVQPQKREYCKIIVRFRNEEDLQEFAALIGQRLNKKSQCTWHPDLIKGIELGASGKVWVDSDEP